MYLIDKDAFVTQILPPHWRKDHWRVNLVRALTTPFFKVIAELREFRTNTLLKVNLNSQVIVLEQHLNRVAGYELNLISISDSQNINEFFVNIPASMSNETLLKLTKEIKKYISADKRYQIKRY